METRVESTREILRVRGRLERMQEKVHARKQGQGVIRSEGKKNQLENSPGSDTHSRGGGGGLVS